MVAGYKEFEFDLPGALFAHLVAVLEKMTTAPFSDDNVGSIPEAQGVYQLFHDGELVYIGKTDAEAGLRKRLERHHAKLRHRKGLQPGEVSFKAVRIYVFTAMDLETELIKHYGGLRRIKWNGSGFGSNDPGRERDTTTYKDTHFDAMFPINIDRSLETVLLSGESAATVLSRLKDTLPYVFRYEGRKGSRRAHPDLEEKKVDLSNMDSFTARNLIERTVAQLPDGWQATKLPSHIILYKENKNYIHGTIIARSNHSY